MVQPLTPESLRHVLGPTQPATLRHVAVVGEVQCDGYLRRAIAYDVPSGRASAFLCLPDRATQRVPVIVCHHQHAGQFDLGKSEVVGLAGDPDQAYAAERGYLTISPDAIGFENRNWAPAWDQRIRASVSNCGCIPYRDSFARDAGFQADFVVPGFASAYDVEDVLSAARACRYLLIAGADDVWSRGAADIAGELTARGQSHVTVRRPGGHEFPAADRELAYEFLASALGCTAHVHVATGSGQVPAGNWQESGANAHAMGAQITG
jgi:hypothetical protein